MIVGYARVSTEDQSLDLQTDALSREGCERIFKEKASGAKADRPELAKMVESLREGDVVVIWKLDRLGRSLKHLVELVSSLSERGIGLRSLNDPIDTTTAQGRLVFNIFASLAEFEREMTRERTLAGLQAARSRGRVGGRPKGLSKEAQTTALAARQLYETGKFTKSEMCERLGISGSTFYKYLRAEGVEIGASRVSVEG